MAATDQGLRQDAARGVFWTALQAVASRGITMVVFVVLARLLDPKAFGVVALATVALSLMNIFVEQGFGQALIQRRDIRPLHLDTAFWSILASGFGLGGLIVLAAAPIAAALHEPAFGPVLSVMAATLPLTAISSVPQALFQRDLAFRFLAERAIFASLLGGIGGVAAAVAGLGVWSLVVQILATSAAGAALLWLRTSYRPRARFSRARFGELFGFGIRVLGTNFFNYLGRNSDDLLIGAVLGPTALGLYAVAYKILLLMTEVLMRTIDSVSFPVFSRVNDDRERLAGGFVKATEMCSVIALPSFSLVAVLAPEIVVTVFGEHWVRAVPVMQALACAGAVQSLVYSASTALLAAGRASWVFRLTAIGALGNVVAFAAAVHWGIVAVALSYALRALLFAPVWILAADRELRFGVGRLMRRVAGPVLSTAAAVAVTMALRAAPAGSLSGASALLLLAPAGLAVYVLSLWVLSPRVAREAVSLAKAGLPGRGRRQVEIAIAAGEAAG